jgi:hypothetical protein
LKKRWTYQKDRGPELLKELRAAVSEHNKIWIQIGNLCLEVRECCYYNDWGYEKFNDWLEAELDQSGSYSRMAMRVIEELGDELGDEVLATIPVKSAAILVDVPKARRKSMLKKAQTMTTSEFARTVSREVPEAHVEPTMNVQVWVDRSQGEMMEDLIKRVGAKIGSQSRAQIFEWIFSTAAGVLDNEATDEAAAARGSARVQ